MGMRSVVERENLAKFIGTRLKEVRKAKGLSQRELGELGINHKYYQRIEAGKVNLTLGSLQKLASALGVRVLELFQLSEGKGKRRR
jgi:transcriptional regulator with XRE-family HTH domain